MGSVLSLMIYKQVENPLYLTVLSLFSQLRSVTAEEHNSEQNLGHCYLNCYRREKLLVFKVEVPNCGDNSYIQLRIG